MSGRDPLYELADRCGLQLQYKALNGVLTDANPDTLKALLRANGYAVESLAVIRDSLQAIDANQAARTYPQEIIVESKRAQVLSFGGGKNWRLCCTEAGNVVAEGCDKSGVALPPIRSGIYDLVLSNGLYNETVLILASPRRAPALNQMAGTERLWGITAALYGLQSDRNIGVGDFEDLAELAQQLGANGAGFIGINPIHSLGSFSPEVISPYSPSHRGTLNTSHIALDKIPGLLQSRTARGIVAAAGAATVKSRQADLIDYDVHKTAHFHALEALYPCFMVDSAPDAQRAFAAFKLSVGESAHDFARFETVAARFGGDWRSWSEQASAMAETLTVNGENSDAMTINFHLWLQWVADTQLADAKHRAESSGMALGLYLDLAVGSRRGGAESFCERDSIASGVSIGAPPDQLSPEGQNWNLAALSPVKLRAQKYVAFKRILRATLRHAGMLRIDHILGMNRSYWIPDDGAPGGYVRQPMDALLAIIKIEAERSGTVIIGEDLGLVPPGFRSSMRANGIHGYSVLQFEKNKQGRFIQPSSYDPQVFACFGTHDTATLEGYRVGADIEWWKKMNWIGPDEATKQHQRRDDDVASMEQVCSDASTSVNNQIHPVDVSESDDVKGATDSTLFNAVHQALCQSPAVMVSAQLDDLLQCTQAQNLPGTIDEHPNWRRRYSCLLNQVSDSTGFRRFADMAQKSGRTAKKNDMNSAG